MPPPCSALQAAQAIAEREAEELREEKAKLAREAEEAAADTAAAHEAAVAKLLAEADKAQVGAELGGFNRVGESGSVHCLCGTSFSSEPGSTSSTPFCWPWRELVCGLFFNLACPLTNPEIPAGQARGGTVWRGC